MADTQDTPNVDTVVIGGGPGGYVAAIRAAQLGQQVVVVEKAHLGGICLNWGCIPTKALLKSAHVLSTIQHSADFGISAETVSFDYPAIVARSRGVSERLAAGVAFLLKKNKIRVVNGRGKLADSNTVTVELSDGGTESITAKHVILATGARTREFPNLKLDRKRIISSREAMVLDHVPESIAIVGAGSIGVEFADLFQQFGAQVTIIEMLPAVLPLSDAAISREVSKAFKKRRMKVLTDTALKTLENVGDRVKLTYERKGRPGEMEAEYVLLAIGVQPNSEGLGLEEVGIATDRGWVQVDDYGRTSVPSVYAIGDLVGQPCLAHVASAQGILAVEHIAGKKVIPINMGNIPACTYCHPEVASVGLTEQQAVDAGFEVKTGRFPFSACGRALAAGDSVGFVKTVIDGKHGKLLGLHIVGAEATELLMEFTIGRNADLTYEDLLKTVHPHPTLSEGIHEAVAAAFGEAIHV